MASAYKALDRTHYPELAEFADRPVAGPDDLRGFVLKERPERRCLHLGFEPKSGVSLDAVEQASWCVGMSAPLVPEDAPLVILENGIVPDGVGAPEWRTTDANGRQRALKAGTWLLAFGLSAERWAQYEAGLYGPQAALREHLELVSNQIGAIHNKGRKPAMAKKTKRHDLELELARARAALAGGSSTPWAGAATPPATKGAPLNLDQALAIMKRGAAEAAREGNAAKARGLRREIAELKLARLHKSGRPSPWGPNTTQLFTSGLSTLPDDPAVRGI